MSAAKTQNTTQKLPHNWAKQLPDTQSPDQPEITTLDEITEEANELKPVYLPEDSRNLENLEDLNNAIDELAESCAQCVSTGFVYHDERQFEQSALMFFAKDMNIFPRKDPEKVAEASVAYIKALDAKDRLEYWHTAENTKEEIAQDGIEINQILKEEAGEEYAVLEIKEELDGETQTTEYNKEKFFSMKIEEATKFGVGDVDSEHFEELEEGFEELAKDDEGWQYVHKYFKQREEALGINAPYADKETEFWRKHKTDAGDYGLPCGHARNAEMSEALQLEAYAKHARGEKSIKPSDGRKGAGIAAGFYVLGVETHDMHLPTSYNRIPKIVPPYYRGLLAGRFLNDYDAEDVENFATGYLPAEDETIEQTLQIAGSAKLAEPYDSLHTQEQQAAS